MSEIPALKGSERQISSGARNRDRLMQGAEAYLARLTSDLADMPADDPDFAEDRTDLAHNIEVVGKVLESLRAETDASRWIQLGQGWRDGETLLRDKARRLGARV